MSRSFVSSIVASCGDQRPDSATKAWGQIEALIAGTPLDTTEEQPEDAAAEDAAADAAAADPLIQKAKVYAREQREKNNKRYEQNRISRPERQGQRGAVLCAAAEKAYFRENKAAAEREDLEGKLLGANLACLNNCPGLVDHMLARINHSGRTNSGATECAVREAHTARELELASRFEQVKVGNEAEAMRRANDLADEYQQQQHSAFHAP